MTPHDQTGETAAPLAVSPPHRLTVSSADRRTHARFPLSRPCKILHRGSRRYAPAHTHNLSAGGALLTIQTPRPLRTGDEIDLFIAWIGEPLVPGDTQVRARVVRADTPTADAQLIGLAFTQPQALAAAA
jgi:c-di-GMP-binding flagellar brake protein YcgR